MPAKNSGIINLHGREYKTVALRVAEFRAAHPIEKGWAIRANIEHIDERSVIVRACIVNPEGVEVAVDYAEETRTNRGVNATSALENCSTSAIGRALAAAGLGGSEYCSADELAGAIQAQGKPAQAGRAAQRKGGPEAKKAPPPPVERQPAKHHPTFEGNHAKHFFARLGEAKIAYEALATFCESRGWGRPSTWDMHGRKKLLDEIAAGDWDDWIAANAAK